MKFLLQITRAERECRVQSYHSEFGSRSSIRPVPSESRSRMSQGPLRFVHRGSIRCPPAPAARRGEGCSAQSAPASRRASDGIEQTGAWEVLVSKNLTLPVASGAGAYARFPPTLLQRFAGAAVAQLSARLPPGRVPRVPVDVACPSVGGGAPPPSRGDK